MAETCKKATGAKYEIQFSAPSHTEFPRDQQTNIGASRTSGQQSVMMQEYVHSQTTTSEKIAMSGKAPVCRGKCNKVKKSSEKKAGKVIEEFEGKWERAASD
jgi:predicted PP-loop superfamily ATPase